MKQRSIKLNAIFNTIRQCLSILFPLITYPYVSRVLGASNLGRYSFSDSIIQILITISIIGIPTYAIREGARIREDKDKLSDFCSELFTINLISTSFSYILLVILVSLVPRIKIENVFVLILSINILSKCLGRDWINSIFEEYLFISIRYVIVHTISLLLIFLLVKDANDLTIYVAIMAFSQLGGNILNVLFTYKKVPFRIRISKNTVNHLKPILFLFCSSIATTIYIRSDVAILGFLRTDAEVGIYSMASKIYTIVKSVLNAMIMAVIPRLSFYCRNNSDVMRYENLLKKIIQALILLLFPAVTGLFFLSGDILHVLGGTEFIQGKVSLQILCGALIFAVIGCFYAQGILIVNRLEKKFFKATIVSALINATLNFIFIPIMGINGAALTTLISEICIVFMCMRYSQEFYCLSFKAILLKSFPAIIECVLIGIIVYAFRIFSKTITIRIVGSIISALIMYIIVLDAFHNEIFMSIANNVKAKIILITTKKLK